MPLNIGMRAGRHHGPNGSFRRPGVPYFSALNGLLIVNPHSGRAAPGPDELVAAARSLGIETHLLGRGENAAQVARASSADVLGVAGGDGSLAVVPGLAIERDAAVVYIPLGTRIDCA